MKGLFRKVNTNTLVLGHSSCHSHRGVPFFLPVMGHFSYLPPPPFWSLIRSFIFLQLITDPKKFSPLPLNLEHSLTHWPTTSGPPTDQLHCSIFLPLTINTGAIFAHTDHLKHSFLPLTADPEWSFFHWSPILGRFPHSLLLLEHFSSFSHN